MADGYMGKLLRVDLTDGNITAGRLQDEFLRKFVGGSGFGVKIVYDEVPPGVGVFDPENRLVFAVGVLTGTIIEASVTYSIVSKAPSTGFTIGHSHSNGYFGPYFRFTGYDVLVIQGASEKPVYLWIHDDGAEVRDASKMWGKDAFETEHLVRKDLGEKRAKVCCIGPAGENLCRQAAVQNDEGHVAARGALGGVMGSKRLKAVAVYGTRKVPIHDMDALREISNRHREIASKSSTRQWINNYGSPGAYPGLYAIGMKPIKNYTTNIYPSPEYQKMYGSYYREKFELKPRPCWNCPTKHLHTVTVTEGPYKGFSGEEPELETIQAWGCNIDVSDPGTAIKLADVCDRLGFDALDLGFTISLAMECYEKGLLTKEDTDGLELTWGNAEAAIQLMEKIARREGWIGNTLAEGPKRAADIIGGDAPKFAIHSKNAAPHMHDIRCSWGYVLGFAISDFAGTQSGYPDIMAYPEIGLEEPLDPLSRKDQGNWRAKVQDSALFSECVGICGWASGGVPFTMEVEEVRAATGWDITVEEALTVGRRIVNLARAFNIRHGLTPEDCWVSPRLLEAPRNGPREGKAIAPYLEGMIHEYYRAMGWDEKTGKPLRETLRKLDLDYAIKDLWE